MIARRHSCEEAVRAILSGGDIRLDGDRPWDIQVRDRRFYRRVLAGGSLALGESHMDGWWECAMIDEMIARLLRNDSQSKVGVPWSVVGRALLARLYNPQDRRAALRDGQAHYDLGNDLYAAMLDRRMVYTCAYWKDAKTLDAAQEAKLDLVCRKLGLKAGQKVLDIGCGWGSFMKFAAERYGVEAVGITVSPEQVKLGSRLCAGLPVDIRLQDYRDVRGEFDHVVSLGMFEHVGYKNYRTFMKVVRRCLKDDGLFLLHTIGQSTTGADFDPWIGKHIFPNAHLPSIKQIAAASEGLFVMEDWHNFGADYDKTLMAWDLNVESRWNRLQSRYDERFRRMWRYYLLMCAGSFRSRLNQLWQVVFSNRGVPGGYSRVR